MTSTAQQALAEFAATYPATSIPGAARNVARVSLLDSMAASFAGRREPVIAKVEAYARTSRDDGGRRAWLTGERYRPEAAALLNAVAVHALDYDDVTPAWRGHPGTVLWPAICASATAPDLPLALLLDAFVIGFEAGAQIGAKVAAHHYPAGWHATATIGVIAAAVACCRVRDFDAKRTFSAIGLATAQSAGLQANFGSMAKPLQAGFAASAAVRAAALAEAGVESGDVLEGPSGFGSLYAGQSTLPLELPSSGGALGIIATGIEVKRFPNCYASHRAVEAALVIRGDLVRRLKSVTSIDIEGTPTAHQALLDRLPDTVDEARFSAEFGVACALLDGGVRLSSFSERQLRREDVVGLMSISRTSETMALGPRRAARVTVQLDSGERLRHTVVDLPGLFGEPGFMQRLRDKVTDCLAQEELEAHASSLWETAFDSAAGSVETWPVLQRIWQEVSAHKEEERR